MKIDQIIYRYLSDDLFNAGLIFPWKSCLKENINSFIKNSVICDLVNGKNIIHLGCCDHISIIDDKRIAGAWLHDQLIKTASNCIGYDINSQAVSHLKDRLGYKDVYCRDISREFPEELEGKKWDFLLACEVIEHIGDPVLFLKNLRLNLINSVSQIIVTVPNAFRLENIVNIFKQREFINSDHRFWFTPYTLSKILYDSGYCNINIFFISDYLGSKSKVLNYYLRKLLLSRYPGLRDTIMAIATIKFEEVK